MNRCWQFLLLLLVWLLLCEPAGARRSRHKPIPPKPKENKAEKAIETLAPGQSIDINQMSGRWYLVTVASQCKSLLKSGFKVESTAATWTVSAEKVSVSTIRKLNFECWDIKQDYRTTAVPGQLFLKGKRPSEDTAIIVLDTDYISYAMMVFKRAGKITMKLYGRTSDIPDKILDAFEERAKNFGLGLEVMFPFPDYGFCESTENSLNLT